MTITKKKKSLKNKTLKNKIVPTLKKMKKGSILYGAKNKNIGFQILDYTKNMEKQKLSQQQMFLHTSIIRTC